MQTVPGYESKAIRALVGGELALADLHAGPSLILALDEPHPSRQFFCVIPLDTNMSPYLQALQSRDGSVDAYCYGSEWLLDAQPDHGKVGGRQRGEISGAITFSPNGALLCVDPSYGEGNGVLQMINLKTAKFEDGVFRSATTFDWRIWQSAEERQSLHGRPLYESGLSARMAAI